MYSLEQQSISCPYCGEIIEVLIDPSDVDNVYIEDCQVCCRPINFMVTQSIEGQISIRVSGDDEI